MEVWAVEKVGYVSIIFWQYSELAVEEVEPASFGIGFFRLAQ